MQTENILNSYCELVVKLKKLRTIKVQVTSFMLKNAPLLLILQYHGLNVS